MNLRKGGEITLPGCARLQPLLDRKASCGNEPPQPVVTARFFLPSNTAQETANEEQVQQVEADDLKGKDVLCFDFAIKDNLPLT